MKSKKYFNAVQYAVLLGTSVKQVTLIPRKGGEGGNVCENSPTTDVHFFLDLQKAINVKFSLCYYFP